MIQQVTWFDFVDAFKKSDTYKDNFSYDGLKALYDYLEQLEEDTGKPIEFDMVALCCDYTEYENIEAISLQYDAMADMDEKEARRYLEDRTTVIDCDNGHIIIQNF
jgi:hypothetical protein